MSPSRETEQSFSKSEADGGAQQWLFIAAATIGLGAALFSSLGLGDGDAATRGAVALVNGEPIPEAEYYRATTAMQAGLKRKLTADDRARALDVLINEELLVQRALELDLPREDRLARRILIQSVIDVAALSPDAPEATDEDLRRFFDDNIALFRPLGRATIYLAIAESKAQADLFAVAVADGERFKDAREKYGLRALDPPAMAPFGKLADYAGGAVRNAVAAMGEDEIVGPISSGDTLTFVWLAERSSTDVDFDAVKSQVAAEWRRRRQETAFDDYVSSLRRRGRVRVLHDVSTDDDAPSEDAENEGA
ncbi:MAG: peptidylprolyl isomerase [Pseudomonadota bacterium]